MKLQAAILASSLIDKKKWNACIDKNANGLVYASAGYLDAMADNWHGLVINNYTHVCPVPWRKQSGFRYAYMPPFMQQLGLTGDTHTVDLTEVIALLRGFVDFADIHFNFSNKKIQTITNAVARANLVINLSAGYDTIAAGYKKDLKENIRKTTAGNLHYGEDSIEQAIDLYQYYYANRTPHVTTHDYSRFLQVCVSPGKNMQCFTRCVFDERNEVLAIALLLKDNKRIYNIMNTTTPKGRRQAANDLLLDGVIHEFAGQNLLFDFEGSELPGVKGFYEKFGPQYQPYFHYHYNGLPWPLRLWKR